MSGFLASIPLVGELIEKTGEAVDRNVTSDKERLAIKAELAALYTPVVKTTIEAQAELDKARMKLMEAMAKSDKFLVYSLRPILCYATFFNWIATKAGLLSGDPQNAFYAFGLTFGIFGSTRGVEKIIGRFKQKEQI